MAYRLQRINFHAHVIQLHCALVWLWAEGELLGLEVKTEGGVVVGKGQLAPHSLGRTAV